MFTQDMLNHKRMKVFRHIIWAGIFWVITMCTLIVSCTYDIRQQDAKRFQPDTKPDTTAPALNHCPRGDDTGPLITLLPCQGV